VNTEVALSEKIPDEKSDKSVKDFVQEGGSVSEELIGKSISEVDNTENQYQSESKEKNNLFEEKEDTVHNNDKVEKVNDSIVALEPNQSSILVKEKEKVNSVENKSVNESERINPATITQKDNELSTEVKEKESTEKIHKENLSNPKEINETKRAKIENNSHSKSVTSEKEQNESSLNVLQDTNNNKSIEKADTKTVVDISQKIEHQIESPEKAATSVKVLGEAGVSDQLDPSPEKDPQLINSMDKQEIEELEDSGGTKSQLENDSATIEDLGDKDIGTQEEVSMPEQTKEDISNVKDKYQEESNKKKTGGTEEPKQNESNTDNVNQNENTQDNQNMEKKSDSYIDSDVNKNDNIQEKKDIEKENEAENLKLNDTNVDIGVADVQSSVTEKESNAVSVTEPGSNDTEAPPNTDENVKREGDTKLEAGISEDKQTVENESLAQHIDESIIASSAENLDKNEKVIEDKSGDVEEGKTVLDENRAEIVEANSLKPGI